MVCLLVFCLVYHLFCRLVCHPAHCRASESETGPCLTCSSLDLTARHIFQNFQLHSKPDWIKFTVDKLNLQPMRLQVDGRQKNECRPHFYLPTAAGGAHHSPSSGTWVMYSKSILTTETIWNMHDIEMKRRYRRKYHCNIKVALPKTLKHGYWHT